MDSYNWTKADTPQGRERLKELLHGGLEVIAYFGNTNKYLDLSFEDGHYWLDSEDTYDTIELLLGDDDWVRFLDPKPKEDKDGN